MRHRKRKNETKTFAVPPNWCWSSCNSAFHDVCMESCAIKKDASRFNPKEELQITDLPPFPLKAWLEEMTPQERQAAAGVYLAKIVDHLQGRKPDVWNRRTRPDIDSSRNSRIPETLKEQGLQSGAEKPDPPHQNREEREDQA